MEKKLVLKNEIFEINKLAVFIKELGEELDLASDWVFNLNLVLEEAVSNVILYGYPKEKQQEIVLTANKSDKNLIFVLSDTGRNLTLHKHQTPM